MAQPAKPNRIEFTPIHQTKDQRPKTMSTFEVYLAQFLSLKLNAVGWRWCRVVGLIVNLQRVYLPEHVGEAARRGCHKVDTLLVGRPEFESVDRHVKGPQWALNTDALQLA